MESNITYDINLHDTHFNESRVNRTRQQMNENVEAAKSRTALKQVLIYGTLFVLGAVSGWAGHDLLPLFNKEPLERKSYHLDTDKPRAVFNDERHNMLYRTTAQSDGLLHFEAMNQGCEVLWEVWMHYPEETNGIGSFSLYDGEVIVKAEFGIDPADGITVTSNIPEIVYEMLQRSNSMGQPVK